MTSAQIIRIDPTPEILASHHLKMINQRVRYARSYIKKGIKCRVSQERLIKFFEDNWPQYLAMHKVWADSKFSHGLIPTIDRIDNNQDYVVENMQLLTQRENAGKDKIGIPLPKSSVALKNLRAAARRRMKESFEREYTTSTICCEVEMSKYSVLTDWNNNKRYTYMCGLCSNYRLI